MKKDRKKLLFICPSFPAIGGVEHVTSVLADFFIEYCFEVFLLVRKCEKSGGLLDKHIDRMTEMKGRSNSYENIGFIRDFIENKEIDIVFNQGVFTDVYKLKSYFGPKVILINTLHSIPFWEIRKVRFSNFRMLISKISPKLAYPGLITHYKNNIDCSDYYIVLNEAFKLKLEKLLYGGISNKKIIVIPNPSTCLIKKESEKEKSVLYVGRLEKVPKRVDRLLKIWKSIEKEENEWVLNILGDGSERLSLENLCYKYNLNNVVFHGYKDTEEFYKKASILALTSEYEGAPLVITEAQINGIVPVAFDCSPALKDMIKSNHDGYLIRQGDLKDFGNKLLYLMKNKDKLHEMAKNASEKASHCDIKSVGNKWIELINI